MKHPALKKFRREKGFAPHQNPGAPAPLPYEGFGFAVTAKDPNSRARVGMFTTPHGSFETPNYIYAGTKASLKNLHPHQAKEAGANIILANTYHLYVLGAVDVVAKHGGLHKFMQWDGPMFTDSGGFQVFSMGAGTEADELQSRGRSFGNENAVKITEEGAVFKSYRGGQALPLTPEMSMDIQSKLGADLIVQMDECTALHHDYDYTAYSMRMSTRWGDRSLHALASKNTQQGMYGVIQGSIYEDLRKESIDWTNDRPFFATAVGGCFGDSKETLYQIIDWCLPRIKPERPVHLLGVGFIDDIFHGVKMGIDTFDCVHPTRIARHGWALEKGAEKGRLNLKNEKYREDMTPLSATVPYTRAYIHHLLKAEEMLAMQIVAQHNMAVMVQLFREIREAIKAGTLESMRKEWIA